MNVGKINSQSSFKGLWKIADKEVGRAKDCKNGQVYERTATYMPFADENEKDIRKALNEANKKPVWECDDKSDDDPWGPDHYFIVKPELGKKLNITSNAYKEALALSKSLKDSAFPQSKRDLCYTESSMPKITK